MTTSIPETPAQPPSYFSGERLRELREAKGYDVQTLAKRLALSPAQLRQLEGNQTSLFYNEAIRLAAARRVSEFLGETLVIDAAAAMLAASASPQICLAEPRMKIDPATHGLSGWTAALWLVVLSFAVLLGLQGYKHAWTTFKADLAVVQIPSSASLSPVSPTSASVVAPSPSALPEIAHAAAMKDAVRETIAANLPAKTTELAVPQPILATTRQAAADSGCNASGGPESSFTPSKAAKDAAQVFVQGAPGQVVCVKDSRGQVWRHEFAETSGRSFFGAAPWVVESAELAELQVYFQGARARPSLSGATRLRLIAAEHI